MAAQVRGVIIERAEMIYKPETLISAVEWPNGWGDGAQGINAACVQLGVRTLAELAEFCKNAANVQKFRVAVGEKAARVNYAMRLAKAVCGQRDPDDKVNRSFTRHAEPPRHATANETPEEEPAAETAEEPAAEVANGAPRMPRPSGMRGGRAIAAFNAMDRALGLLKAGCSEAQVEQELKIDGGRLRKWAKKYPDFASLSGVDAGARRGGRKAKPDAVREIIRQEADDAEPFPPFPEDEETASEPRAAVPDYHTRVTDKVEKSEPRLLSEEVSRGYHPATGDALAVDALNDRITGVRGRVEVLGTVLCEAVEGLTDKFQKLFEETGRDVAEALGRLWVDDAGVHPFVLGLVRSLPAPGTVWPLDDRRRWIHCAESLFALMYKLPADPVAVNGAQPGEPQAAQRSTGEPQTTRTAKAPARRRPPADQPIRRSRQPLRA